MPGIDCLLIVPHFTSGEGSILKSFEYTMPPLGLLSIASYLRENQITTDLLDLTIEDLKNKNIDDILTSYCKSNGVPKWFGLSVCTPVAYNTYDITKILKSLFPESKIVLGGPHVTVLKERVFDECNDVDYLISGEGEYTLLNLIKNNDISPDNLFLKDNPAYRKIVKAETVLPELLPMPAYDLLKFDRYVPPPASLNSKHPGIGIITTRGCPFQCTFCTKISGSHLRFYTIKQVVDQIKYLKEKFKIKQFHFYDDTITCKKKYITELCQTFLD
ncbi:MAG: hypothetical protein C0596_12685 [Marinilabiliales bacterium]|nr:MAG: hypothetical protein C0596_12685 [Marinilabiliales bacterium]